MSNKSFLISTCLLILTAATIVAIAARGEPVVVATNLENLPMEIADFKATEDFFPESVHKELNADKHIYRHYRSDDGSQVDLYIGYYGTAKGGRTGHNPYACLPGAGWGIIDAHKLRLKVDYYSDGGEINYILARRGETYESILHWYQSDRDKILANGVQQNIQRFLGRILENRNDGAFVRVSAFTDKRHIEEANKLIKFFAERVLALLPDYWPVEKIIHSE